MRYTSLYPGFLMRFKILTRTLVRGRIEMSIIIGAVIFFMCKFTIIMALLT